jgi:hypothetical protein
VAGGRWPVAHPDRPEQHASAVLTTPMYCSPLPPPTTDREAHQRHAHHNHVLLVAINRRAARPHRAGSCGLPLRRGQ